MKKILLQLMCILIQLVLRLRYKITYKGLEAVKEQVAKEKNGVLFMPNHPAVIVDPLIVTVPLLRSFSVRPLIIEYMFYNPFIHWIVRLIGALPMPNFSIGFNTIKQRRAEKILQQMSRELKKGERFLIYPAGGTKQIAKEVVGGAFGAHQLISENPLATVILVRMTGLWGSMFSRALTNGDSPNMQRNLKKALWTLLKNALFFVPRRQVLVEFEIAPPNFPKNQSKVELNRYLEKWYNKPFPDGFGEPLNLVSYAFWKNDVPKIDSEKEEKIELADISDEVKEKIVAKVAELANRPVEVIVPSSNLQDLGLDSLNLAELVVFLEDHFEVTGIHPGDLTTVSRLFLIAAKIYQKPEALEPEWNLKKWNKKLAVNERLFISEGETIGEVFLRTCDKKLFDSACGDFRTGVSNYRTLKMKALLLSEKIRQLPGDRIGILLPSSTAVQVLILATLLANKTPVMINWTVGGRHLDTVVELSKVQAVLTSWSFLDNLENVDISRIEELLVILEELRLKISFWDILKANYKSLLSCKRLVSTPKFAHLLKSGDKSEAVILFTSGTEAMPKGVPLTHKNILSNQRAVLQDLALYSKDCLLSMLPPFHSFGFSVTGLLPLLCGLKVVYYPNPTDSKRLAKAVRKWSITTLASAPTFLKNILHCANREELASLRLVVSGAEKAPLEFFELVRARCPQAEVYEGYGITECSPVLSVNTKGKEFGVGRPIGGVQFAVVHPEDFSPLGKEEIGLVLACGPNVFSGYLNQDVKSPFVEIEGVKWYETGDLGRIDHQGNLILAGRLKRFVKVGGEMLSLVAMEEALSSKIKETENSHEELVQVAIMAGKEMGERPKLTLFTRVPLAVLEVNQILRQKGFSNLVKIDHVQFLEEIPMTATGKVAYRTLEKMME